MKFDVVTFGSATCDIFLKLKKDTFSLLPSDRLYNNRKFCFSAGSKINIQGLKVFSGGGGTNTASAFQRRGFETVYIGKIGADPIGKIVANELGDSSRFLKIDYKRQTALSVVFSPVQGDRTIFTYDGACHFMEEKDIPWKKIKKTAWFYIAPLRKQTIRLFEPLVNFAKEHNVKIAANLSEEQINLGLEVLGPLLSQLDLLILNQQEAALLSALPKEKELLIIRKLASFCSGIIVVTRGREGSLVYDHRNVFSAGIIPAAVIEKTGAGDAYGSGFLIGLLEKNDVEYAIQAGTANAASCIGKIGAKNGLLAKKELCRFPQVKIEKQLLNV